VGAMAAKKAAVGKLNPMHLEYCKSKHAGYKHRKGLSV